MEVDALGSELKRYLLACGSDPDKLAAFEVYVSLLAARDEAREDGDSPAVRERYAAHIAAARDELRYQIGEHS